MFDRVPEESGASRWMMKLIVISACAIGIGFGLCGLDAHLYPHAEFGGSGLAVVGAALMALSVIGFGVVALVLLVRFVTLIFPK